MLRLRKPTNPEIESFVRAQSSEPLSYVDVGATRTEPPRRFQVDTHEVFLGHGREVYERARVAISQWKMFPPQMATLYWCDCPIETGREVVVLFPMPIGWSLNPCRIVYTFDEEGPIDRFGFAYGTLPEHLERGEEQFSVEWRHDDDSVHYRIFVFSRPNHWLAWLGYPYARFEQSRFRKLSGQAMIAATANDHEVGGSSSETVEPSTR